MSFLADASITRRELSLGSQDTVTGWYAASYAETTIQGSIQPRGAVIFGLPVGGVARYPHTFYTADAVAIGDEILDANDDYYIIKTADQYWRLNQFSHYQCELEKRSPYALRPTTSGTWHLDTDSLKTDPRYRHKTWLDSHLTANNMQLDNGTTNATIITCFSDADYPLTQVFLIKDVDGIMSVGREEGSYLYTNDGYPYAEIVSVPITCSAIDKSGLTATNLVEQMEKEIEKVATDHPLGSKRSISATKMKSTDIGGTRLWETTITIRYKRANDDYSASYPRLTWGASGSPDGTFRFPNCTRIEWPNGVPDIWLLPPGRVGNTPQIMGDSSLRVRLYCDLDVDADYTWKRPQTSTPKTDRRNDQVLWEIKHGGGIIAGDEPYQTLTFGANGPSFNVRLVSFDTVDLGEGSTLMVEFEEYVASDQSGSSYSTRWGYS